MSARKYKADAGAPVAGDDACTEAMYAGLVARLCDTLRLDWTREGGATVEARRFQAVKRWIEGRRSAATA